MCDAVLIRVHLQFLDILFLHMRLLHRRLVAIILVKHDRREHRVNREATLDTTSTTSQDHGILDHGTKE